jgi:hypothetical protein
MRIFTDIMEAVREVERDLWEMGVNVHPQTMQDKNIATDPDYMTKEVRGYGFKIVEPDPTTKAIYDVLRYIFDPQGVPVEPIGKYIDIEHGDRVGGVALNPGNAAKHRSDVWNEFMHDGKFAYTYSERISPQLGRIVSELRTNRETRQAIINIHSNISASNYIDDGTHSVLQAADMMNMGGASRIPCSMYYQMMIREGALDLIYTMRSCDFLVHFPIDIILAIKLQCFIAIALQVNVGTFTYFTGSLHAYAKEMKTRGIF